MCHNARGVRNNGATRTEVTASQSIGFSK